MVLGQTVVTLDDLEPGATATVDAPATFVQFGQSMSDKVVGAGVFGEVGPTSAATRQFVRHNMVDQLTYDPMFGSSNVLPGDGPVVLAWGSNPLLDVTVSGQKPDHLGNVLYYVPADLAIRGKTTFRADLLRSTVVGHRLTALLEGPDHDRLRSRQCHAGLSPDRVRRTVHGERPGHHHERRPELNRRDGPGRAARVEPAGLPGRAHRPCDRQAIRPALEGLPVGLRRRRGGRRAVRSRRPDVAPVAAFHRRDAQLGRRPGSLRRSDHGDGPRPLRQRHGPTRSVSRSTWRSRGTVE